MTREVFLAVFVATTLGWITLQIVSLTILKPLIRRGRRWMKAHSAEGRAHGLLESCKCCFCGDEHDRPAKMDVRDADPG